MATDYQKLEIHKTDDSNFLNFHYS